MGESAPTERATTVVEDITWCVGFDGHVLAARVALTAGEADAILATGKNARPGGVEKMKATFAAAGFDWPA